MSEAEGSRFGSYGSRFWVIFRVEKVSSQDRWIMSRLAQTLQIVDSHMAARAPHLAFNTLHQFILGQVCDVYLVGLQLLFMLKYV